jgi:arsenate reductase-like glutaredoxin family protein
VKKLNLGGKQGTLSEDELLRLMIEEPNLIKRPLIIVDGQIVAGFDKAAKPRLADLLGTTF